MGFGARLCRIVKGVAISTPDAALANCGDGYRGLFLDYHTLMRFAADPQYQLSPEFVRDALARGDECYGFLAGDELASYGWYSKRPVPFDPAGLILHFDDRYVCLYKSFTHPAHLSRGLHAAGMMQALSAYLAQGYRGIVSCVEWNDLALSRFGAIVAFRLFDRVFVHCSAGCREYGFRLERRRVFTARAARRDAVLRDPRRKSGHYKPGILTEIVFARPVPRAHHSRWQ